MAPLLRRLALLASLTTTIIHAHSFRTSKRHSIVDTQSYDGQDLDGWGVEAGQELRRRADARLCGSVDGGNYQCPGGQVCSVDHSTKSIGCCGRSDKNCEIASSCKGFGGDSFFGGSARAAVSGKPTTCSSFPNFSCQTYNYVSGPYNGYVMYGCNVIPGSSDITMLEPLDSDSDLPSTTTSTTSRPRPTTESTRTTTTRPSTTQATTTRTSRPQTSSTTAASASQTSNDLPPTATDDVIGAPTTGAAFTSSSSAAPTVPPAVAADSSATSQTTNVGAIVGGVLGGLAGIAIIAAAIFYFLWYRKKRREEDDYLPPMGYTPGSAFHSQPPVGTSQHQAPSTYDSARGLGGPSHNAPMSGGAGYGVAAATGAAGALGPGAGAAAAARPRDRYSRRFDPGSASYGKTMDDTGASPTSGAYTPSISPPDSPTPVGARPVSPPKAYNRFNPPPPEHFRAYKPYEGT
ncbi:cell wall integrity and stress response component [Microdochium nivale]|nr:cell wall integrity and stress response component [Microdochium nivale]